MSTPGPEDDPRVARPPRQTSGSARRRQCRSRQQFRIRRICCGGRSPGPPVASSLAPGRFSRTVAWKIDSCVTIPGPASMGSISSRTSQPSSHPSACRLRAAGSDRRWSSSPRQSVDDCRADPTRRRGDVLERPLRRRGTPSTAAINHRRRPRRRRGGSPAFASEPGHAAPPRRADPGWNRPRVLAVDDVVRRSRYWKMHSKSARRTHLDAVCGVCPIGKSRRCRVVGERSPAQVGMPGEGTSAGNREERLHDREEGATGPSTV
jgi:hypothetical protein